MPNYTEFMMRHGEFGAQAIVEQLERYEGIHNRPGVSLEERWNVVMRDERDEQLVAA